MSEKNILKEVQKEVGAKIDILHDSNNTHSRYQVNKKNYRTVLVKNIPFIFTCDEKDKLVILKNHSIAIKDDEVS